MSGMLKLMAEDAADLDIIAAAAQDALLRVGDVSYDKKARRCAALINRFRWEQADKVWTHPVREDTARRLAAEPHAAHQVATKLT